jgi:sporulation protein YlmC with PRC-barrel domain
MNELEEGERVGFRDLIKVKVRDGEGKHIGHVQEMALDSRESPRISYLGIHLLWTDRVGEVQLVRSAEDLVVLVPWDEVATLSEDEVTLRSAHPAFPVRSAAGKLLVRRDILDKQMVDPEGTRIQRVDDVQLTAEGKRLTIAGLEVSKGMLMTSSALRRYMDRLRKKHAGKHDYEVIPWEAVVRIEPDSIVIGEDVRPQP